MKLTTLYGERADVVDIIGYCRKHKVHLTERQAAARQCFQKGCRAFERISRFRGHKELMKEIRRMKRDAGIPNYQKVEIRTDRYGRLLPKLKKKR